MNVLVTGCNGFVGKHLVRELSSRGVKVFGLGFNELSHPEISDLLETYFEVDLTNKDAVAGLALSEVDAVINLAGLAKVGDSFAHPDVYKKVNVEVLTNIGEELLKQNPRARVIAVSTGALYDPDQQLPLTENSKITAGNSPYAESKLLMEEEAESLRKKGLDCIVVRPFNHIGPGQEPGFLLPDLLEKIVQLPKSGGTISVGNLKTRRDYTDVRDIAKAYSALALAKHLGHGLYNICSGKSRSGEEILESILVSTGAKNVAVKVDKAFVRPSDPQDLYGSNERLRHDIGWQPEIPLRQTIEDFVKSRR